MKPLLSLLAALTALAPVAAGAGSPVHVRDVGWVFPDFELVLPAPCVDDEILFFGDIVSTDNIVMAPGLPHDGALHDNWRSWYDGEWTALRSGATYELALGSLNHAVVLIPPDAGPALEDLGGLHQEYKFVLVDPATGERLTLTGRATLVKNAAGEIKVENLVLDLCRVAR